MVKRTLQVIVAVGLLSPLVFSEVKTFTWIPPTERVPDSNGIIAALMDSEIKEYQLHCNSGLDVIIKNVGFTDTWTSSDTDFPPGFYTCWLHTVDIEDLHSSDSNHEDFSVSMQFEVKSTPKSKGSGCS